eukprot:5408088-Alexandrium_andersonii.AAC.1
MSASLVGSEMCIRDSLQRMPVCCVTKSALAAHRTHTALPWLWAGRDSVSYTHLTLPTICSV